MIEQTGPRATLRRLRREWPDLRYALEKLPLVARKLVDDALDGPPAATWAGATAAGWRGDRTGTAAPGQGPELRGDGRGSPGHRRRGLAGTGYPAHVGGLAARCIGRSNPLVGKAKDVDTVYTV